MLSSIEQGSSGGEALPSGSSTGMDQERPSSASSDEIFRPEAISFSTIAGQERLLIRLNLIVLVGLFLIHVWHFSIDRDPELELLLCFALRFAWQIGDLVLLRRWQSTGAPPFSARVLSWYYLAMHVGFAWLTTLAGDEERSHYIVLMAIPVAGAGFRLSLAGSALVWLVAAAHSFFEVWHYQRLHPPPNTEEDFEAGSISLLYLVVLMATYQLARQMFNRQRQLAASRIQLAKTREAMMRQDRQAAVGRLSRAIAHEIRNPLTMISSTIALWREKPRTPQESAEVLDLIHTEAARLEKLTSDFLDFARERRLQFQTMDARDALCLAADVATGMAEASGLALEKQIPARPLLAELDPSAIQQVLLNLLRNAIEASDAQTPIRLGLRVEGLSRVAFWVENTGQPIAPEMLPLLFQPFESSKPSGAGLGLATSAEIARVHGGELVLEANTPACIRFALMLPMSRNRGDQE